MIILIVFIFVLTVTLLFIFRSKDSIIYVKKMIEESKLVQARETIKRMLLKNYKNPTLHILLAKVYEKELDFEHAVVEYKIVIKNGIFGPSISRDNIIEEICKNYIRLNMLSEALNFIEEESKKKLSSTLRLWKAEILSKMNRNSESLEIVEKLIKEVPSDIRVLTELGKLYFKNNRTDMAIETLETVVRSDRKNFNAWFYLGEIYYNKNEIDRAIECFENSKYDKDLRPLSLFNLSRCYKRKDMNKNATEILERLASEWESDLYYSRIYPLEFIAECRYELAELYLYDKDYQNALDQWQIIKSLIPEYKDVNAKIQANARYGKDRIQDFLIIPVGEFEKICLFAAEQMGYFVEKRHIESGEKMFLEVHEQGKIKGRRLLLGFYRVHNPVGETLLLDFDKRRESAGLKEGEVYSATGFTPNAVKFVLERPIKIFGKSQVMKILKSFENRFLSKK